MKNDTTVRAYRIRPIFAVILLLICTTALAQNQKPRFVVSVSGELNVDLADVLADEISYAIIKTGKYDLIANDRQFKDALKKEWKSGNVDDSKIIALAQKTGADYICFAKIKSLLGSNQITAQLVDLKTMLYGSMGKANGSLSNLDQLTKLSQAVVADMLGIAASAGIGGNSNTFTDTRDGKQYKTVKIDDQTWMAENLNYEARGSKCYENDEKNCKKYGRLYDWETAKKACHRGWHLPNDGEWSELVNFAGGNKIAGKKLKAAKFGGTDDYGFSALPGGDGNSDGSFSNVGNYGSWWSSSEYNSDNAYSRTMYYSNEYARYHDYGKSFLQSVRCLQD